MILLHNDKNVYTCTLVWNLQVSKPHKIPLRRIRYGSVIWFFFHVIQLLLIRCTHKILCCMSRFTIEHMHIAGLKIGPPMI